MNEHSRPEAAAQGNAHNLLLRPDTPACIVLKNGDVMDAQHCWAYPECVRAIGRIASTGPAVERIWSWREIRKVAPR